MQCSAIVSQQRRSLFLERHFLRLIDLASIILNASYTVYKFNN